MSKKYTRKELATAAAELIKSEIAQYEASVVALRKKELERAHGKLNKSEELCRLCAGPESKCGCSRLEGLAKAELAKKTPPDISEKTMHKLKNEYGHDEKGKEKAYATAWSIENKMDKAQMSTSYSSQAGISHGDKGGKAAFGDGPHDQRPAMHQSNMGAMNNRNDNKAPIGKAPMKKDELGGEPSSMMMNEKTEKCEKCGNPMHKKEISAGGKPENYSEEANGGATKTMKEPGIAAKDNGTAECDTGTFKPSVPKAENYSEEANGNVTKAEIKTTPEHTAHDEGNGDMPGKKMSGLKKTMIPSGKPPQPQGVTGKQPIGMGGGDAGGAKVPGLASASGLSSVGAWKQQGLPQLKSDLQSVRGGAGWLKSKHSGAARIHPAQAAPTSQRFHGAMPLQRNEKGSNK